MSTCESQSKVIGSHMNNILTNHVESLNGFWSLSYSKFKTDSGTLFSTSLFSSLEF